MPHQVRRVVTGHDQNGKGIVTLRRAGTVRAR